MFDLVNINFQSNNKLERNKKNHIDLNFHEMTINKINEYKILYLNIKCINFKLCIVVCFGENLYEIETNIFWSNVHIGLTNQLDDIQMRS